MNRNRCQAQVVVGYTDLCVKPGNMCRMTTEVLGPTANTASAAWIPDDSTFGARLALIRQRMAWGNVKEAAEACGIPVQSWRTWERDGVEPRGLTRIARQVAERTGCDYGWLVGGLELAGRLPASSGTVIASAPTLRYADLPERTAARRPIDNRPGGHPTDGLVGPRRTTRVARPGKA